MKTAIVTKETPRPAAKLVKPAKNTAATCNSQTGYAHQAKSNTTDPVIQMCEQIAALELQEAEIFKKMEPISQSYPDGPDIFFEPSSADIAKVEAYKKETGYNQLSARADKVYNNAEKLRDKMHLVKAQSVEGLLLQIWDRCANTSSRNFESALNKIDEVYISVQKFSGCEDSHRMLSKLLDFFRKPPVNHLHISADPMVDLVLDAKCAREEWLAKLDEINGDCPELEDRFYALEDRIRETTASTAPGILAQLQYAIKQLRSERECIDYCIDVLVKVESAFTAYFIGNALPKFSHDPVIALHDKAVVAITENNSFKEIPGDAENEKENDRLSVVMLDAEHELFTTPAETLEGLLLQLRYSNEHQYPGGHAIQELVIAQASLENIMKKHVV